MPHDKDVIAPDTAAPSRERHRKTPNARMRALILGGPELPPSCPVRSDIIGPWRPEDARRTRALVLGALVLPPMVVLAIVYHNVWMFYVELLISLCT